MFTFQNVPVVAALVIIALAGIGFLTILGGSVTGHPLDATAQGYVWSLVQIVIGLAIGTSVGTGVGLHMAALRKNEP